MRLLRDRLPGFVRDGLAVGHVVVDEGCPMQAAGGGTVVVEGIGRHVVGVVPGIGCDPIPPGVAVGDSEALNLAGDLHGSVRRDGRTLGPSCVGVVRPGMGYPSGGLGVGRRWRRRRRGRRCRAQGDLVAVVVVAIGCLHADPEVA